MSTENIKAFIEKLSSDETVLNQIAGAENNEARLQIAKEAGVELSAEELSSVIEQFTGEELSEDELDAVAGGGTSGKIDYFKKSLSKWKVEEGESLINNSSSGLKW